MTTINAKHLVAMLSSLEAAVEQRRRAVDDMSTMLTRLQSEIADYQRKMDTARRQLDALQGRPEEHPAGPST